MDLFEKLKEWYVENLVKPYMREVFDAHDRQKQVEEAQMGVHTVLFLEAKQPLTVETQDGRKVFLFRGDTLQLEVKKRKTKKTGEKP